MLSENKTVNGVWVGDNLSLLEQLTIKLLQIHGHEFHLWTYGDVNSIPENTVIRNAKEILPKSSIFRFNGIPLPYIPNGGIGSLSHWADHFTMKFLSIHGGTFVQLDVTCLLLILEK